MKRTVVTIIFLFAAFLSQSQPGIYKPVTPVNFGDNFNRGAFFLTLGLPTANGIPTLNSGDNTRASLYYNTGDGSLNLWQPELAAWSVVGSSVIADITPNYFVNAYISAEPGSPVIGDYLIKPTATGTHWTGHNNNIAHWDGATWTFTAPSTSLIVQVITNGFDYRYTSTFWQVFSKPLQLGGQKAGYITYGSQNSYDVGLMTNGVVHQIVKANGDYSYSASGSGLDITGAGIYKMTATSHFQFRGGGDLDWGAGVGTSGQVATSQGANLPVIWTTVGGGTQNFDNVLSLGGIFTADRTANITSNIFDILGNAGGGYFTEIYDKYDSLSFMEHNVGAFSQISLVDNNIRFHNANFTFALPLTSGSVGQVLSIKDVNSLSANTQWITPSASLFDRDAINANIYPHTANDNVSVYTATGDSINIGALKYLGLSGGAVGILTPGVTFYPADGAYSTTVYAQHASGTVELALPIADGTIALNENTWGLFGNAGTVGTMFGGTTDAQPVGIGTNGITALGIDASQFVDFPVGNIGTAGATDLAISTNSILNTTFYTDGGMASVYSGGSKRTFGVNVHNSFDSYLGDIDLNQNGSYVNLDNTNSQSILSAGVRSAASEVKLTLDGNSASMTLLGTAGRTTPSFAMADQTNTAFVTNITPTTLAASYTMTEADGSLGNQVKPIAVNGQFADATGNIVLPPPSLIYPHVIFAPSTGNTITALTQLYNIINPSGALLALTVDLPSGSNDGDVIYLKFTKAVTTVTYTGATIADGITSPIAGELMLLVYDVGTSTWY